MSSWNGKWHKQHPIIRPNTASFGVCLNKKGAEYKPAPFLSRFISQLLAECGIAMFICADANSILHIQNKDFAITNLI